MSLTVQHLTTVLPSAVSRILRQGPMSQGKLGLAWRVAVGPAIDRATEVRLCEDGTVEVLATAPAWRRELKRSHDVILTRLRDLVGHDAVPALKILSRRTKG